MIRAAVALLIVCVAGSAHAQRFVSPNGDNTTGTSWATAFTSVSAGVTAAQSASADLWIAAGTYAISSPISVSTDRHIYGGFPATGDPGFGDRDPVANPAVLDANSTGHIFVCSGATNVIFDGLQFTEAAGGGTAGGAIRAVSSSDIDVNDCVFFNNGAQQYGGGVYLESAHADITSCTFSGNTANEAGALMLFNGTANVSDCTFSGNTGSQGGAILVYQLPITITRCVFSGNNGGRGGAVAIREGTGCSITNSLFVGNTASDHGGGINLEFQNGISIVNNTFVNGTAATRGGGVFLHDSGGTIANCVFVNNNQRAIYENSTAADPTVRNNLFYQNPDGVYFDEASTSIATAALLNSQVAQATGNIDGNPDFVSPFLSDYHIRTTSAAKNAGSSTGAPSDDFDTDPRGGISDPQIDIGFDEFLDTDTDGLPDYWEIKHGLNPGNSADASGDFDGDGLTNLEEYGLGTLPNDSDTDNDGVNDGTEISLGIDPLDTDSDNDFIPDGVEVGFGTNPADAGSPGAAAWIDFAFAGSETGTYANPYNTLAEGLAVAPASGLVALKPGTSLETPTINQNVVLRSFGGTARIGGN